jgi:hypothetical protein
MTKKTNTRQAPTAADVEDMDGNVDKIRDILFGGQMRDYDKRFADMEKRLTAHVERLSNDLDKRIERLGALSKREIEKLAEQLKTERKDRIAADKQGAKDQKDMSRQVEGWFAEVEEQFETETKDLRLSLHDQNEELSSLISRTRAEITDALAEETSDLASTKLGREDLAGLLAEVALRLKKDFKLPKA